MTIVEYENQQKISSFIFRLNVICLYIKSIFIDYFHDNIYINVIFAMKNYILFNFTCIYTS